MSYVLYWLQLGLGRHAAEGDEGLLRVAVAVGMVPQPANLSGSALVIEIGEASV